MPDATRLFAEALAAIAGCDRLLTPKPKPLTKRDQDKALDVLGEIKKLATALVEGKSGGEPDWGEPGDYAAELERLTAEVPAQRRLALGEQLSTPDAALAFLEQAERGRKYLLGALPKRTHDTLMGPKPSPPSRLDLAAYWRARAVVNDPRVVLRNACAGILVSDEVAVMRLVYPELFGATVRSVFSALAEAGAREGEDWMPLRERMIETILGVSRVSPEFAKQLQEAARQAEAANKGEENPIAGMPPPVDVNTEAMTTGPQRIAAT